MVGLLALALSVFVIGAIIYAAFHVTRWIFNHIVPMVVRLIAFAIRFTIGFFVAIVILIVAVNIVTYVYLIVL